MTISLIVEDCTRGKKFDLSGAVQSLSLDSQIDGYPTRLDVMLVEDINAIFYEGARTTLKVDGVGVFLGYVFQRSRGEKASEMSFIAYDQTRYLQNRDTMVFENKSVTDIFSQICKEQVIDYDVVNESIYLLPESVNDNSSFYEMIQSAVDITLQDTAQWFVVYDDFGICKIAEIGSLATNLVIGDASLLSGFTYGASIDSDSYNQIKLVYEYKGDDPNAPEQRDIYLVRDENNAAAWGLLQYFETVTGEQNEAQLQERANLLLKAKNRVVKSFEVECMGDWQVRAGRSVFIDIRSLENEGVNGKYAVVLSCTHELRHGVHTMRLSLQMI